MVGFEDSEEATKDIYKRAVAEFAFVMANIASACPLARDLVVWEIAHVYFARRGC